MGQDGCNAAVERVDVVDVARLARLELTPEEAVLFQAQLDGIVEYVRQIRGLDVAGIEPTSHAHPVHNVLREDVVEPGLDAATVLANAPARLNDLFRVPKIVD